MDGQDVSELNAVIHELISFENIFYPASIKNDNGPSKMRLFLWLYQNQQLNKIKMTDVVE